MPKPAVACIIVPVGMEVKEFRAIQLAELSEKSSQNGDKRQTKSLWPPQSAKGIQDSNISLLTCGLD